MECDVDRPALVAVAELDLEGVQAGLAAGDGADAADGGGALHAFVVDVAEPGIAADEYAVHPVVLCHCVAGPDGQDLGHGLVEVVRGDVGVEPQQCVTEPVHDDEAVPAHALA